MRTRPYTVHEKKGEVRVVTDRFDIFALALPPLWAIWHGLWLTLASHAALIGLAFAWSPIGPIVVEIGVALILGFEGGAVRRAELRLRGWREAGVVEARSAAGAEELFLRGEAT
ncbi:MAG TPA: DUF2628 domain-containing protein [Thermohalobaculum sp.]|nr:DUF2628 domain-containing protein [Thermohalobaculum sp.]